jgi:hypothetical protein
VSSPETINGYCGGIGFAGTVASSAYTTTSVSHNAQCQQYTASGTSISCTITGVLAGDALVATFYYTISGSAATGVPTNSVSGTFSTALACTSVGGGGGQCIYYQANAPAGTQTITINFPSQAYPALEVDSFTNASLTSPIDGTPVVAGSSSGGTSFNGATFTPGAVGEMTYGNAYNQNYTLTSITGASTTYTVNTSLPITEPYYGTAGVNTATHVTLNASGSMGVTSVSTVLIH